MLAVVVDDHDMGVTHVIEGGDHLNNAFRQLVIIRAMHAIEGGWPDPTQTIFLHYSESFLKNPIATVKILAVSFHYVQRRRRTRVLRLISCYSFIRASSGKIMHSS